MQEKQYYTMPNTPFPDQPSGPPVVSLVIPIFNAGAYLEQCLDSIQNQSVSNLEIICINDGSSDGSGAVLQRRAQNDSRLTILSQENSGPAAARNRGLAIARGRYLGFIDADDWIDKDYVALLLEGIQRNSADIIRASIINEFPQHSEPWHGNAYLRKRAASGERLGLNDHGYYVWNALYDLARLRSLGLDRFDMGCDGLEDMPFTVRVMHTFVRRYSLPDAIYHYRREISTQLTAISLTKIQRSLVANRLCIDFANAFTYFDPKDYADVVARNLKNLISHFSRGLLQIPDLFDISAQTAFYLKVCEIFREHVRQDIIANYHPSSLYATLDGIHFEDFLKISLTNHAE